MKLRSTPGRPKAVRVNDVLSPKTAASTPAPAWLTPAWPEGYSWKTGVTSSGVQVGSAVVSGLPSVPACWIAVIGRQVS